METLLHSCAEVREPIKLFEMVSGVGLGIRVLYGRPCARSERGGLVLFGLIGLNGVF